MQIRTQLPHYLFLLRLHKPIGILLLLWPTLWALWLAGRGHPDTTIVSVFILGTVLMRSAGCALNDWVDRKVDGHVERTRLRPLVTGKVSSFEALSLVFVLSGIAFALVVYYCNRYAVFLSLWGAVLAAGYPFLKRITHLPQVGLGLAFAWGVPMAFAAQTNAVPGPAWFLFFTCALWPIIYDTQYAMVDRNDDERIGVKSTAILFGQYDYWIIGILQLIFLVLLTINGYLFGLEWIYYCSVVIAGCLFAYQQQLIKTRDRDACFSAFLNNHWIGLILFLGIYCR